MSDSVRKAHRLDRSYIITQTEITRALWPFPRTAANVYQNIRHKALHNSLFCHENAEGYSTVEEGGELMCYCRRVASLFQKYGIRSDLHAIDHQKRKERRPLALIGNAHTRWLKLLETLKDADESSWCKAYKNLYKFSGTDEELKSAMSQFYKNIIGELHIEDNLNVKTAKDAAEALKPGLEKLERQRAAEEALRKLERSVQEDILRTMEREEASEMRRKRGDCPAEGKRLRRKPARYRDGAMLAW